MKSRAAIYSEKIGYPHAEVPNRKKVERGRSTSLNVRKEVDVAGTVADAERSEAAPEGGSGGPPPEIFVNRYCKCCNLSYSVAYFVPVTPFLNIHFQNTSFQIHNKKYQDIYRVGAYG